MKYVSALVIAIWLWLMPATLAAAVIAVPVVLLAERWPGFVWLLLAPLLYVVWLVSFLLFCGPSMRRMGRRHPKPRRATIPGTDAGGLRTVVACSLRFRLISSLPLVPVIQQSGWGRDLVLGAYAPSIHIGKSVQLGGYLTDPDLTEIGDDAVLGTGVGVSGHVWSSLPSGKKVYISAPVKIGARATVGADTTIHCGVTIGEDSVIEPRSYLAPYTEVPPGEIWSGCPAVFQRKRARARKSEGVTELA
jgi:acetyltransferase-like isoleucine patch superfamily enzyme